MHYLWPKDTVFEKVELEPENRDCPFCGRRMHICDHRHHKIFTRSDPLHIVSKLAHCPEKDCPGHHKTFSPDAEMSLTMPWWLIGWDVFAWIGHRRFARHWSVPQIHDELLDTYQITLSEESIRRYIYRYQTMLAARQQDPQILADEYRDVKDLILSIDGLQPEKGHETLYVVRELRRKRVWFAESLISSSAAEVQQILTQARQWAERLGLPVRLWVSDKQDAFVSGIAAEFPEIPHRYCENHFLRDVADPVLEIDSHAKVMMCSKVRGLRSIERDVFDERRKQIVSTHIPQSQKPESQVLEPSCIQATCAENPGPEAIEQDAVQKCCEEADFTDTSESQKLESQVPKLHCAQSDYAENPGSEAMNMDQDVVPGRRQENVPPEKTEAGDIVLDYCTAVRGILNDNHGGPLNPPGLRMAAALSEVRASLHRNLEVKKGAPTKRVCDGLLAVSTVASCWSKPSKSNCSPS